MLLPKLTGRQQPMTKDTTFFESKPLEFIAEEDPLLSMLQWVTQKPVEVEGADKIGTEKGMRETNRVTCLIGHTGAPVRHAG